ncbi:MAG: quinone oxidoreductase [Mycobacteriaceae bacterium]|nr:quinone oxidoreductase [Mycobacteriaceae bacterium]
MHAIQITEHGGPEVLRYAELPDPSPGPGQLLVRTAAIGVNYIDVYFRTGAYPAELPLVPGKEGAGVVAGIGSGVTDFTVGDRVAWGFGNGSYAELAVVEAAQAVRVPDAVEWPVAASALLQGMTAHYLLESVYRPETGETVLVHAGAGGVGLMLTQLAAARGVRVVTTVSSDAKAELSSAAGAWQVLRYGPGLAQHVRELTGGEGVSAVYDGVGADTFDASLASLRVRGTMALFGAASGPVPPIDPQRLNAAGSVSLSRPSLVHFLRTRDELLWRAGDVFAALADGTLSIRTASYPLAEAARAHRDLESRSTTGSLVLTP